MSQDPREKRILDPDVPSGERPLEKPRDAREARLVDDLTRAQKGGPEKYREKLATENKLFVRERLKLFFPEGLAFEDGVLANWHKVDELAADGMVTGAGDLEGRRVFVIANDYTIKAGSMAEKGVEKFLRTQERALKTHTPVLYLIDSSGGRITDQSGFFANRHGIGRYFYNHSLLSGVVPQICVMYGPCVAGAAYTPVFCDFVFMVRKTGSAMVIASPRMVEMVTGEKISMQELGGPDMHAQESGSCDVVVEDEEEAAVMVKRLMSYLPASCIEAPPRYQPGPPARDPKELMGIIPEDPNKAFDMHGVIDCLIDEGSWFELKPEYAPELITGLARIEGQVVGFVANNSAHKAGAIFPESSDKAAHFIWRCDSFNIPLVYLSDTPGFMVGPEMEKKSILMRGRKFIYATSMATVPKFCVVVRKAYGAGIYAMCGPAFEPEATLALPGAEIAIMGPEAAINAVYSNKILAIPDGPERKAYVDKLREDYKRDIDVHVMADDQVVDHVVPPTQLRDELSRRLRFFQNKDEV
ncbi:MAG TPA: acyl-CoA carboxylase subunit beta, partial [Candidatus Thermoplasmatota archaeon]|nr:acyl-CoA carboxylase subunit beta [Candidatus Thermoplasmatota archaeon]